MLFTRLLETLPSQCALCRSFGMQALCERCVRAHALAVPRCTRCALEVPGGTAVCGACLTAPPAFDAALAGVDYAHPWSQLVTQLKFHDGLGLTRVLVAPLQAACRRREGPGLELVLPVPLSPQRLRQRGYNQAWEVARRLAGALRLRADARLLLRVKDGPHQLSLPPEQRAANVRGAFAVEPLRRAELRGRRIAVVDDVMTTGATFSEIAKVLKAAGAAHVEAWAVARTPRPA